MPQRGRWGRPQLAGPEQMHLQELDGPLVYEDLVLAARESVAFALEGDVLDRAPEGSQAIDDLI